MSDIYICWRKEIADDKEAEIPYFFKSRILDCCYEPNLISTQNSLPFTDTVLLDQFFSSMKLFSPQYFTLLPFIDSLKRSNQKAANKRNFVDRKRRAEDLYRDQK